MKKILLSIILILFLMIQTSILAGEVGWVQPEAYL